MEQENLGTIVPGEEIPPNAVANTENTETSTPDIEQRARAMGWRPQEEFNGDQSKWKTADEFVAKGENDLPVLRENLRRTTSTITDLQARMARQEQDFKSTISRVEKMSEAALQRQRDQLESNWAAAQRNATASGDLEHYDRLEAGKKAAIADFDRQVGEVRQPAVQEQPKPTPQSEDPVFQAWHKKNPWYLTDHEMTAVAEAYSQTLVRQNPTQPLEDNMRDTENWMRKRYPEKFGVTAGAPPAVEGGGTRMTASASRGKGWNDLPGDARAQGAKFIKDGLFKDQNDYAKEYWSS